MGERETRETSATTRSQSVVHYTERTHDHAAQLVSGLIERGGSAVEAPSVVVITPSVDDALILAAAVTKTGRALTPITSTNRGRRILSTGPQAIVTTAADLASLVAESRVNVGAIQAIAVVWPEEILDSEHGSAFERILGELPKAAERVAVAAARTPALTQFLERAMWRARSVDHATAATTSPVALRVLTAAPSDQLRALRTILDAYDPPSAVLLTSTDEAEIAAREAAAVLDASGNLVEVRRGMPVERVALLVFFDDVPSAEELDGAAALSGELIAMVRPSRLAAMQKVAPQAAPLLWSGALGNARSAHDALRDEIRAIAEAGAHLPWVPLIEPLLAQLDAVEVGAAALSMLERERRRARRAAAIVAPPVEREARPKPFTKDREERRGERSFGRDREERGERPGARDRGERSFGRPREGGYKPGGGGRKFDDRGPRSGGGRDRPDRPRGRFGDDSRERRPRRDDIERVPRAAREGREWSERGERLKHSRRGPRRNEGRDE